MKRLVFLSILLVNFCFGQNKKELLLNKVTTEELKMSSYKNDSLAEALVLEEFGRTYLSEKHNLDFRTDYYNRTKIFNTKGFDKGTIKVSLYDEEKIIEIEAFSYQLVNGQIEKTKLDSKDIFKKDINDKWEEVVFTIPNLQEGSIIEYKYSTISPYPSIDDWYFQSDIPKLKSDFEFSFLGNYKYNIRLVGGIKLDRNENSVNKKCVYVPGIGRGQCGVLKLGMDNIPAFKKEDFMLSEDNYLYHVIFDLVSLTRTDGTTKKYTKTWKDVDRYFKESFLDGQINKKNFFVRNLPEELLSEQNELNRTKKIYKHIQNRFSWNERYWSSKQINIRKAYDSRTGGVDEINLSLYNSLQAAQIESYIVMIATRDRTTPTKLFPVANDFNYIIVKAVIGNNTYFLDATDKFISFGQLPLRCLNGEGRVLDFKNGSYWQHVKPINRNSTRTFVQLKINEDDEFEAKINIQRNGYFASNNRKKLSQINREDHISNLESNLLDFEIFDYSSKNDNDLEKPLIESYSIVSEETISEENKISINPFLTERLKSNPFKLKERIYPVNFGYIRSFNYILTFNVPEDYELVNIPKSKKITTPNNGASLTFRVNFNGKVLSLNYRHKINKAVYSSEDYYNLKEYFNELIKVQSYSIELEKNN